MPEDNLHELYMLAGLIIIGLFAIIIVREITKPRTVVEEITRDEQGRIVSVVRREV